MSEATEEEVMEIAGRLTLWQRAVVRSLPPTATGEMEYFELKECVRIHMHGADLSAEDDRIDLHNESDGLWDHAPHGEEKTFYWLTDLGRRVASVLGDAK